MFITISTLLGNCITAVWSWFDDLITATGTGGLLVAAISGCMAIRFFIVPLIGAAGSEISKSYRGSGRGKGK